MTTNKRSALVGAAMLALGLAAGAQGLPKEGRFDAVFCWSGTHHRIDYSKQHVARSFEFMGVGRSTPPGGLFDKSTFRCVGTDATFDGKLRTLTTTCEGVDPDGDRRLSYFSLQDGKTVREHVAGTGKWDGITLSTSVTPLGPFPPLKDGTFQDCNHQTGTYRLK